MAKRKGDKSKKVTKDTNMKDSDTQNVNLKDKSALQGKNFEQNMENQ